MAISWIHLQQIIDEDNRADLLTKIIIGMEFLEKAQDLLGSNNNSPKLLDNSLIKDE